MSETVDEEIRLYRAILDSEPVLVTLDPEALARAAQMAIAHMQQQVRESARTSASVYHELEAKAQAVIDANRLGGVRFSVALTELAELLERGRS